MMKNSFGDPCLSCRVVLPLKFDKIHQLILTLVLLNCFNCIFRLLKLELLTQFPVSNDEESLYSRKIDISEIEVFDERGLTVTVYI